MTPARFMTCWGLMVPWSNVPIASPLRPVLAPLPLGPLRGNIPWGAFAISSLHADQVLGSQQVGVLGLNLIQKLPEILGVLSGYLAEVSPEVIRVSSTAARGGGHRQLGALEFNRLPSFHFSPKPILRKLHRSGAVGSKEVVDVIRQEVWIRAEDVVSVVVRKSGIEHGLHLLEVGAQLLELLHHSATLLGLSEQGVLHGAGVAIQQCRGLCAEVLQDLKTFVAYPAEIPVACVLLGLGRRHWHALRRAEISRRIGWRLLER